MNQSSPETSQILQKGLRRVIAPNPSPMTHWGTNSYILGTGHVAVIDPGPLISEHLDAILGALEPGEEISHILITHSHLDHSPLAKPLSYETNAPVYGFGGPQAGRSNVMTELAIGGLVGGGEGVDADFAPDVALTDGQTTNGENWQITAHWTPGHFGNHLCFQWDDAIFTGDHVMGWASSLVSPPDGDLTDFMASTRKLAKLNARVFYPGHGAPVDEPAKRCRWLIQHRQKREADILAALFGGASDTQTIAAQIYAETPKSLLPAAERNVLSHLIDLVQSGQVVPIGPLTSNGKFALA